MCSLIRTFAPLFYTQYNKYNRINYGWFFWNNIET